MGNTDAIPFSQKPITTELLQTAFKEAVAQPPIVKPKPLSPIEKLVALQRKYAVIYQNGVPEDMETLIKVIPTGLKRTEVTNFLRGSLEEAKYEFLVMLNKNMTKKSLYEACAKAGLGNTLKAFDSGTRKRLEGVIRYKTDE